jgi:hypothetical protein
VLAGCAYPDVLVAQAVSDGDDLRLVLRPGAGDGRQTLALSRLLPGRTYDVAGALQTSVEADRAGDALVDVDLRERLEVHVTPRH